MRILILIFCFFIAACKPDISEPEGDILEIQRVVTKENIEIWLVEDASHPIIAMNFTFKGAGAINEMQDTQGTARLLSNTMDEGAGDYSSQEFQKTLSDNSISLRFSSGRDNFGGSLKTLSRHQDKAFELLKLAVNKPRFDPEPVERMRKSNMARIQSDKGDPDWIAARLVNDVIYQGNPYALNSGGTLSTLAKVTPDDLRAFHDRFLTKDRLVISVVGDIDAKKAAAEVDKIFGALPNKKEVNKFTDIDLKNQGKIFIYKKNIPQSLITVTLPSIKQDDADYYAFKVMNVIFGGGGFGSRLMEEVREKRGLTYGIYSDDFYQKYASGFKISTSTKNESAKETLDIITAEMKKMVENVSDDEIEKAKSYIVGSLPLALTSTDKIANIVQNLQTDEKDIHYLDQFTDNINAVTAEDIKRITARILKPEIMSVVIVGQPDNIENFEILDNLPNVE